MNRQELAHILRAACDITGDARILVIGSQAILSTYDEDELPALATASVEADIAFLDDPDRTKADDVEGSIGELSAFHELNGVYAEGVHIDTATYLPSGWRGRLVGWPLTSSDPADPRFLERHDLAVAKLGAGRDKDHGFVDALIRADLLEMDVLRERCALLADEHALARGRVSAFLASYPIITVTAEGLAGLRGGLLPFCYQLLGSPFDAEDAVQDTMERAWRARHTFDPERASLSTWTFRIARNVCVDRLRQTPRRPLPRDLSDPGLEVGAPLVPALDVPWLLPAPTSWWGDSEPEASAAASEGVRVAVTAVLQALPPRQRGVFILRDVLGHSAADTAAVFELSVTAVNSALQRARAAVEARAARRPPLSLTTVERYARAIERADVAALADLVAADVVLEMPPVPQWSLGRDPYAAFMAHLFAWRGTRWATRPIRANGQHGILLYLVTDEGPRPHTVQLVDAAADGAGIGHVLVYQDSRLFALFEAESTPDR